MTGIDGEAIFISRGDKVGKLELTKDELERCEKHLRLLEKVIETTTFQDLKDRACAQSLRILERLNNPVWVTESN